MKGYDYMTPINHFNLSGGNSIFEQIFEIDERIKTSVVHIVILMGWI